MWKNEIIYKIEGFRPSMEKVVNIKNLSLKYPISVLARLQKQQDSSEKQQAMEKGTVYISTLNVHHICL